MLFVLYLIKRGENMDNFLYEYISGSEFYIKNISRVFHKIYKNYRIINPHKQNTYRLLYLSEGSVKMMFEDSELRGKKGDIILLPPGDAYQNILCGDGQWEHYVIAFDCNLPLDHATVLHTFSDDTYIISPLKLAYDLYQTNDYGCHLKIKSILYDIFYKITAERKKQYIETSFVKKAMVYMDRKFNKPITVKDVTEYVGYSESYFITKFTEQTGISPKQYLQETRMKRAKEVLETGLYSVSEISDMCGYKNIYHFSNAFKKTTGLSPSQYMKNK
ncbi:MAG: AraC family transcriptional regulator [Ruminococcaceae bacterium]|nr:AraC family transcriptional regulator [Oscillospiraceae bacterium]